MKHLIPAQDRILNIAQYLHWWTNFDLSFWFTGDPEKRMWFVERTLPKMRRSGLLKMAQRNGDKRYYYTSWSQPSHLEHGIVCTRALLEFWAANRKCEFVSENKFRAQKFGVVPEWTIVYPNQTGVLFEFCMKDNVGRKGLVVKKVNFYKKYLERIERHFDIKAVCLFVLDTKDTLKYALDNLGATFAYFVDLKTFARVETGNHLTAPIYIWGGDGNKYPLKKNAKS